MKSAGRHKTADQKTESDETYTPPWLFEALGLTFDLDVAAPKAQLSWVIPAAHKYTKDDDALTQPWFGKVWMNPPYSKPKPWVERFIDHGNGIALLPFTRAHWFADLWDASTAIKPMLRHENKLMNFVKADGTKHGIYMPTALFAMGVQCAEALKNLPGRTR